MIESTVHTWSSNTAVPCHYRVSGTCDTFYMTGSAVGFFAPPETWVIAALRCQDGHHVARWQDFFSSIIMYGTTVIHAVCHWLKSSYVVWTHTPNQGPGPQPRHVPWPGIEPATFQFAVWRLTHWATPGLLLMFNPLPWTHCAVCFLREDPQVQREK